MFHHTSKHTNRSKPLDSSNSAPQSRTTKQGAPPVPTLRNPPLTPHSPPSLPEVVLKQVEDGWNALSQISQKHLLTISIPENYKANSPRPFPKLNNLFETKDTAINTEDEYNPNPASSSSTSAPHSTSTRERCQRQSSPSSSSQPKLRSSSCSRSPQQPIANRGNHVRPSSVPPQSLFNNSQKITTNVPSTSERMRHLQQSKIEVQNVPDEFDFDHDDSIQAIHQRRQQQQRIHQSNDNDSRSSISSQWSNGGLLEDNDEGASSHTEMDDDVLSGSRSTLIDKGLKLLKTGKHILHDIENNRSTALKSASLQEVANTLHGLVMGELHVLQQENEMLRVENMTLKENKVVRSEPTKNSRSPQLQRVTAAPVLNVPGNYIRNNASSSTRATPHSSLERGHDINPNFSPNFITSDTIRRVSALEESVTRLLDQINTIQDRLYQQEIRYEETLGKVEDVAATLTSISIKLQQQVTTTQITDTKIPEQIKFVETINHLNEATQQLAALAKCNRKVQFKGILKK